MEVNLNLLLQPTDDVNILTARMRHHRDRLLAESDWTQLPDSSANKQAWADYRQALRDLPSSWTPGSIVVFPTQPA
jgi:hypothetical protein